MIRAALVAGMAASMAENVTIQLNANSVQGQVPSPGVIFLGVYDRLSVCESACISRTAIPRCTAFTWHHPDFEKPEYRGHCYGRTDDSWEPKVQQKIDSGCRTDVSNPIRCKKAVAPPGPPGPPQPQPPSPQPPSSPHCREDFDCGGANGHCHRNGSCGCKIGWTGPTCSAFQFKPASAAMAYPTKLWTWGGSPIRADDGIYHLFSSEMSEQCGILHYCVNSRIIHLTSQNPKGPYGNREVVLAPRATAWDNGAIHGVSVHRLPNGTYALFYMGAEQPGMKSHPNCTAGSGDSSANTTTGSHNGRRIGIAIADSLNGPWRRQNAPLFGPDPLAWDNIDVSNPSPIIHTNGSVIMLYKGRGSREQHMGLAFADKVDGPYRRNDSGLTAPNLPGEDPWGWIDDETGIYHAVFHTGNGMASAGSHRWSHDGIHWAGDDSEAAYTGNMSWAVSATDPVHSGKITVLARRERPQILLSSTNGSSYGHPLILFTSAEDCVTHDSDAGTGIPCPHGVGTDMSFTALELVATTD